jgi:transposase-like protein
MMEETPQQPVPSKYNRRIPGETKAAAILAVWQGKKTVAQICQELCVSKEAFYQWERKAQSLMTQMLNPENRGRHPKNHVEEQQLRSEVKRLDAALAESEKEKQQLARKTRTFLRELQTARHVANFFGKLENSEDGKKKDGWGPPLKRLFSLAPKKPLKPE